MVCPRALHEPRGSSLTRSEPETRRDPVQRLERESDLDEVGVSCLPHPVHRPLHPGRAGLNGCHRCRGREAEVVVAVPMDGHRVIQPLCDLADEEGSCFRCRDSERVDDDDLLGAGLDGALVRDADELEVGPRRVDAEERHANPLLCGKRDRPADALQHRLA